MSAFLGADVAYPEAAVVFCPAIPDGSSCFSGNFKAAVVGLDGLDALLLRPRDARHWNVDRWRAFAHRCNLERVERLEAAFDPQVATSEALVTAYCAAFRRAYGPVSGDIVPFACRDKDGQLLSEEIVRRGAAGADLFLRGPSGCGKSLLAACIGVDSINHRHVPILIPGKNFAGRLGSAVAIETALLDAPSAASLLSAARCLGYAPLLIIDGYNETLESDRSLLTRASAAAARRYGARLVVTGRYDLERPDLLELQTIDVVPPDLATKTAIALQALGHGLPKSLAFLLETIETGLEARLIGEIGGDIPQGASRYAIFDRYARRRLAHEAAAGIRALSDVAGVLAERVSFSLTVRDLDRLADRRQIASALLKRLQESGLLVHRGERVAFAHELFLNAFVAEALLRDARGQAPDVLRALRSPRNDADRRAMIVGAIDDETLQLAVLSGIVDSDLIASCLAGLCGAVAKVWADRRCTGIMKRVLAEIEQTEFEIHEEGWFRLRPKPGTLLAWSEQDSAFLPAIAERVIAGDYFDWILDAARTADRARSADIERLRDQARKKEVALRSGIFGNTYAHAGGAAISRIFTALHNGGSGRGPGADFAERVLAELSRPCTNGEVFLLLALDRWGPPDRKPIAPLLPDIIRRHWPSGPYHLRLDLLYAAQFSARATDSVRQAIREGLEELTPPEHPFLSSAMGEALQALGAFEDAEAEHLGSVRSQLQRIFAAPADPNIEAWALGVWFGQFDHPFAGAYCEVVSELSPDAKKHLLLIAAAGADLDSPFVSVLIKELAECDDPEAGTVIGRWTALPPTKSFMAQDAIGAFAIAHIALGRLRCPLPPVGIGPFRPADDALMACGQILYWLNRHDLPLETRRANCGPALAILSRHERGVAVGVIREFHRIYVFEGVDRLPGSEPVETWIGNAFPAELAEICRQCLARPEIQEGYFTFKDLPSVLEFAVYGLGVWGSRMDIATLRDLSRLDGLGRFAVAAIKTLEASTSQA
jgi:hypothetical protein